MKKIFLTGSTGFVGKRFIGYSSPKYEIIPFSVIEKMPSPVELKDIDAVVHLGGLAHQMISVPPERYFEANFERTKALADLAKANKVSHFIFISTIKVFGEHHTEILTRNSVCKPLNDPYGESKLMAEQYLNSISDEDFIVSIIRPPLIYGPGVKGNLDKLLNLCDSNYLLPFGSIHNRRTMIYLDNLIELIHCIIDKKKEGIFLAGDDRPVSTDELVTAIRKYLGRPLRLITIPSFARHIIQKIQPALGIRLFGSMEMDTTVSYNELQFNTPYSIDAGIKSMVDAYVHVKNRYDH